MKPYKGTAEGYVFSRLPMKLAIALLFGWAYCIPGCAAAPVSPSVPSAAAPQSASAAACLSACTGATYAEVSPKGDLCRCWAPGAFQYTFDYPADEAATEYPRERWNDGIRIVKECTDKGWAWEADETGDHLRCVQPSGEHGRNYEVPSVIPRRPDQSGRRT